MPDETHGPELQTTDDLRCELIDVDGETVRVRVSGTATWTIEDLHAFSEIVRAARRRFAADLFEEGRRLASQRDDLIAQGVEPDDLEIPHAPELCCDLHGRNCEPPSELCCERCTEAAHPQHRDGSACSNPDRSGFGQ